MPEIYTPPNSTDSQGVFELFRYVNVVADGLLFPVLMLVFWVMIFIATKQFSTDRAFTYASFISMILAIPLALLNLLSSNIMYLFMIFTAAGAVWLKLANRSQLI